MIYTNRTFLDEHPTAAEDFMRATMPGLADAIADPEAAAAIAVDLINANGNPNFLSPEGETFRWAIESQLVVDAHARRDRDRRAPTPTVAAERARHLRRDRPVR